MLDRITPQSTTPLLKQVARFAERRQEVLAGNIANIDTPGYRMRDLPESEFRQALARAVAQMKAPAAKGAMVHLAPPAKGGLGGGLSLSTLHPETLLPSPLELNEDLFPERLFRALTPQDQPGITFQDGNNRSLEHQFLEMTKNRLWQNFALELLRVQYDQLQSVIAERP